MTQRQHACQRLIRLIDDRLFEILQDWDIVTLKKAERCRQHAMLERRVPRTTQRTSEREVAVQHPRRARSLGLAADETDPDRRQTGRFEHVGERTHGARAQRSNRGQQDDIDTIVEEQLGGRRSGVEPQGGQGVIQLRAHERDVTVGDRTDRALCR